MPIELIKDSVQLDSIPQVDNSKYPLEEGVQFTKGDLHANALTLIFSLIKQGIASNINPFEYLEIDAIYNTAVKDLTEEQFYRFNELIDKMKINKKVMYRLIGDELGDRGSNDYFVLKILSRLKNWEVLLSNHGVEFLEATEIQTNFKPPMLLGNHAISLINLDYLVEVKKFITRDEILTLAAEAYKPHLLALSYSLSDDESEITIYSHAGIGLKEIESLARKLETAYQDDTAVALAQSIDRINTIFQKHVQSNTVHKLYDREVMNQAYAQRIIDSNHHPFEFIMWNRYYYTLDRPSQYKNYKINWVHGHDLNEESLNNVYNLDNNLGKGNYKGEGDDNYLVLYANQVKSGLFLGKLQSIEDKAQEVVIAKEDINLSKTEQFTFFTGDFLKTINNTMETLMTQCSTQ